MFIIFCLFVFPILLAIASLRWSVDTRDSLEHPEWERRFWRTAIF